MRYFIFVMFLVACAEQADPFSIEYSDTECSDFSVHVDSGDVLDSQLIDSESVAETDTETETEADIDMQSDVEKETEEPNNVNCFEGQTKCLEGKVVKCVRDLWKVMDECTKIGMVCFDNSVFAHCVVPSEKDTDLDTGGDTDTVELSDSDTAEDDSESDAIAVKNCVFTCETEKLCSGDIVVDQHCGSVLVCCDESDIDTGYDTDFVDEIDTGVDTDTATEKDIETGVETDEEVTRECPMAYVDGFEAPPSGYDDLCFYGIMPDDNCGEFCDALDMTMVSTSDHGIAQVCECRL